MPARGGRHRGSGAVRGPGVGRERRSCIRTVWSVIKGVTAQAVPGLLEAAIAAQPGPVPRASAWSDWSNTTRIVPRAAVHEGDVLVICDRAWPLAKAIAQAAGAPHLELRVQEGDHWDFTLYLHGQVIADFSTRVSAFDDDPAAPRPWKQGSADELVRVWGCTRADVEPYLIDWDALSGPRWCRQGDRFATGSWKQVLDFMRAMCVPDPANHARRIEFEAPEWTTQFRRRAAWRRFVRGLSVWLRGVYPDVPAPTAAQKQEWSRRRRSVRAVRRDGLDG